MFWGVLLTVWKQKGLYFLFSLFRCFQFSMKSVWNESCTESISYTGGQQYYQRSNRSVSVSQPALERHLVAERGTAWPCSEAFSGSYCRHNGNLFVLSDSSVHCYFFFNRLMLSPQDNTKDPSLRKHT